MERCPQCRARIRGNNHCSRCGMELEKLLVIEAAAQRAAHKAVVALADGDTAAACRLAERARRGQALTFHRALVDFLNSLMATEKSP